jgi:small GTP-binding protein
MMRTAAKSVIRGVLDDLDELADGAGHDVLAALRDRLDSARLRVLVAGEAKRGKSTLVNALLGRDVLPTGAVPLTAVPTTVTMTSTAEAIEVEFTDGRRENFPLAALPDFGTERGNPGNCRNVASISVGLEAPILARGMEIVDMPGTGSVHAHNTAAADAALPSMDAAIFVLTADPPVSATERELLHRVSGLSVALFIVLNKADYLDDVSLAEAHEFTTQVVTEATGRSRQVYPMSARRALAADGDAGFSSFAADFNAYLDSGRIAGLEASVSRHALRYGQQLLDEVALARRAAQLAGDDAAEQIAAFAARLDAVTAHRIDAEDRATAQSTRLLDALNTDAEQVRPELSADIASKLTALLEDELSGASPADIERLGRTQLTGLVRAAAEAWRQDQASRLEAGLQSVDQRLGAELEAELAKVRAAAADLLGLDLAVPSPGDRLVADARFFYTLDEHVDQAELLAGAVRRRIPGQYGRRLARQQLLAQVAELVGAQVGRARGDLQYRLAESTRQLISDLRRRYAGSTQWLAAALERADAIRGDAGHESERQLALLAEREQALRRVLSRLASGTATARDGQRLTLTATDVCDGSDLRDCRDRCECGRKKERTGDEARHKPRNVSLMASTTVTGDPGVGGDISDRGSDRAARQR